MFHHIKWDLLLRKHVQYCTVLYGSGSQKGEPQPTSLGSPLRKVGTALLPGTGGVLTNLC